MSVDSRARLRVPALAASLAMFASACAAIQTTPSGTGPSPPSASQPSLPRGGTLRLVIPLNDETVVFRDQPPTFLDFQQDFIYGNAEFLRCCLARTLMSHNGRSVEEGGARLHPDLAETPPEVSADGRTWTFRVKRGVHYGPPLQAVEITAQDFVRSFHRLFAPTLNGNWHDFGDIEGALDYQAGRATSITGLEAPDAHTLVFRLTQALGDFGARLAEPFAAPLPPNPRDPSAPFGAAQGADSGFGPFLVSSGPYMLEGSEKVDFSVAADKRMPASGLAPGRITFVRNPSWDRSSDDLRQANVDRIEIVVVDTMDEALAGLDRGQADVLYNARTPPQVPPDVYAAFQADPARGNLYAKAAGSPRGMIMNLALPPFDDVHVRRALNLLLDKQALVDLQGGPAASEAFGHMAPDSVEDGLLLGYDPHATVGNRGDLAAAKAEMVMSRYDTDGDGVCDASACLHIRATARDAFKATAESARDDFAAIGIGLDVEILDRDTFFTSYGDARGKTAMYLGIGFFSGYIGAAAFFVPFDGRLSIRDEEQNGTLIGATPEQLKSWGYEVTDVPNVDARVEACIPLVGAAQFQCWASLDQYLTEQVVPWIPYSTDRVAVITSQRVVGFAFDELMQAIALDQVAIQP